MAPEATICRSSVRASSHQRKTRRCFPLNRFCHDSPKFLATPFLPHSFEHRDPCPQELTLGFLRVAEAASWQCSCARLERPMKPVLMLYATREGHTRRVTERLATSVQAHGLAVETIDAAH